MLGLPASGRGSPASFADLCTARSVPATLLSGDPGSATTAVLLAKQQPDSPISPGETNPLVNHLSTGESPLSGDVSNSLTRAPSSTHGDNGLLHVPFNDAAVGAYGAGAYGQVNRFAGTRLEELIGKIPNLCKGQHGCRYLQKKLAEGIPEHLVSFANGNDAVEGEDHFRSTATASSAGPSATSQTSMRSPTMPLRLYGISSPTTSYHILSTSTISASPAPSSASPKTMSAPSPSRNAHQGALEPHAPRKAPARFVRRLLRPVALDYAEPGQRAPPVEGIRLVLPLIRHTTYGKCIQNMLQRKQMDHYVSIGGYPATAQQNLVNVAALQTHGLDHALDPRTLRPRTCTASNTCRRISRAASTPTPSKAIRAIHPLPLVNTAPTTTGWVSRHTLK
ncbi:unnamed protein product [Peniophora sp. CBMAI 1063]|nr:unnamed protein product [Peniophora sp. CBMAI 1063]